MSAIQYASKVPDYTKGRDVRIPLQAAQVVHDIDANHARHPPTCLELLSIAFQGSSRVMTAISACSKLLKTGVERQNPWEHFATIARKKKLVALDEELAEMKVIGSAVSTKAKDKDVLSSPIAKRLFPDVGIDLGSISKKRLATRELIVELSVEPFRFTEQERKDAQERAEAEDDTPATDWGSLLNMIITAIVNKADERGVCDAIEDMCSEAIDVTRGASEAETAFVNRIEKNMRFSVWLSKTMITDEDEQDQAVSRNKRCAYQAFKRGIRASEQQSWNFLDTSVANIFDQVVRRVNERTQEKIETTVAVAVNSRKREENSDSDSEKEKKDIKGKKKKPKATRTAAVVEQEDHEEEGESVVMAALSRLSGEMQTMQSKMDRQEQRYNDDRRGIVIIGQEGTADPNSIRSDDCVSTNHAAI